MWKLFKHQEPKTAVSPADGKLLELKYVHDRLFSNREAGDGFAVVFEGDMIVSPVEGIVDSCFPSGHEIGIRSHATDVILHIGIDTVEMNGDGFTLMVQAGDRVQKGDPLVKVQAAYIREKGYDPTTIVVFPSGEQVWIEKKHRYVRAGEEVAFLK